MLGLGCADVRGVEFGVVGGGMKASSKPFKGNQAKKRRGCGWHQKAEPGVAGRRDGERAVDSTLKSSSHQSSIHDG